MLTVQVQLHHLISHSQGLKEADMNKMFKKWLSVLLAFIMATLCLSAVVAFGSDSVAINETNFPDANFREFVKDYDSSELQKYPEYNDVDYDIEKIRENSVFINNIVTHKKFVVHNSATIIGSVKAYKNMCLEENVKIWGNVFCERDLVIGNCCRITGTVFVQGCLKVGNNVVLGEKGKIKSVIVRKNIVFGRGIVIHGFVLTEGVGKTI